MQSHVILLQIVFFGLLYSFTVCAIWFSFQSQQKNEKKHVAISSLQIKIMTFLRLQLRKKKLYWNRS